MSPRRNSPRAARAIAPLLLLVLLAAPPARAGVPEKPRDGKAVSPMLAPGNAMAAQLAALGLPRYEEPAAYRVDLVIQSDGEPMRMKRFVDHGRIRTEMTGEGHDMVMIELGDDRGTSYMLMPEEKRALKQSRAAMEQMAAEMAPGEMRKAKEEAQAAQAGPARFALEDLGDETLDGRATRKVRFAADQGSALGWFDKATGAPARLESASEGHKSVIEWKDLQPGPQPATLFEIPKKYEVTDMDAMMAQMKSMGARNGLAAMGAMPGTGGAGVTGMAKGMAGNMAQNFGQSMGSSFGSGLGSALGGPVGAIAGQYIGGRIGGMLGRKAADMVTPGK